MTAVSVAARRRRVIRLGRLSLPYDVKPIVRAAFVILTILAVVVAILPMGSYDLAADRVWATVFHPGQAASDELLIVWEFRIPRILLAILVGGMLAVAGALMQSVTRNGLADPGLIGVTEGATVAILFLVIAYPALALAWRPAVGLLGGFSIAALVLFLTKKAAGVKFILIGIGVSAFIGAGISLFMTYGHISQVQSAMIWMAGSLAPASWEHLDLAAPWAIGGFTVALLSARATDAALLGDAAATGLGVHTRRLRMTLIITSVSLTAACVSTVGSLGFVGLVGPHIARFLIGAKLSSLVIGSALCGGALVLIADSLGRIPFAPIQIPAGIVMALVGVPFFILLLWRRRHTL